MPTYPDSKFQGIYDSILASMGDDDTLKANIEAALRPMYEQSLADLNQRRLERNAQIDVDAASRGMGNSTWVTDAKLRQLKDIEGNIATLDANYNNQLYANLADAIKDRDDKAYNQAMDWWKIKQGSGKASTPEGEDDADIEDNFEKFMSDMMEVNPPTLKDAVLNFSANKRMGDSYGRTFREQLQH